LLPTLRRGAALAEPTIKITRKRVEALPAETRRIFKIVAAFGVKPIKGLLKVSPEMRLSSIFGRRKTLVLVLLTTAVLAAVTYGVVTYQTPYGCGSNGVATGPGVDRQVLAEPCIYIYFTGIVGGSVLLILVIPVPEKKTEASSVENKS